MKLRFYRESIRNKIFFSSLSTLLLTIIIFVTSYISITHLGQASNAILKRNYHSILAVGIMSDALGRQDQAILMIANGFSNEGESLLVASQQEFTEWLGRAKDNITESGEKEIVESLSKEYHRYQMLLLSYQRSAKGLQGSISAPSYQSMAKQIMALRYDLQRLKEINQTAMFKRSERAATIAHNGIIALWITGIGIILLGLSLSLGLANRIVKPLLQLIEATQHISEGDYGMVIPVRSTDELGILSNDFNTMTKRLKGFSEMNLKSLMSEKQKIEAIVHNINDGIIFVDEDLRVVNLNQKAADAFQLDAKTSIGKHFLEVINNEQLFSLIKSCADSGVAPNISEDDNIFSMRKQNARNYYQYFITPVTAENSPMLGVLFLLRDVTKLKELDQLKSEFVMIASHELKTPLTSIGMSIELLLENQEGHLKPEDMELLIIAREDIMRLRALISDLLDVSKIEAGKIDLEFASVHACTIFENVVALLKLQAEEKKIEFSWIADPSLPNVKADESKIIWVLTNLIGNALRYVKPGGFVKLSAERMGKYISFSVTDNGAGIPYEYQKKIFDKFVQVKENHDNKGTGLGLAISKEIVRAHGGAIWVESVPGQGSHFTFTIPIWEEASNVIEVATKGD